MRYSVFEPHITAFSTERGDEIDAAAPYSGFNINPWCGDDAAHVARCRHELCSLLGIADERLVLPQQVHGVVVANIDNGDSTQGADAVMTAQPGLCIGVSTADCLPVLLHDTRHDVLCAVHSGWRGTVARITARALEAMARDFGTDRADVVAAIGPGIRRDAFEVGDEVYDAFSAAGFNMDAIACRMRRADSLPDGSQGVEKWHIDLVAAILPDLAGVRLVHDCGICSYTSHRRFFSARRLGVKSGRIFTAIMMRT